MRTHTNGEVRIGIYICHCGSNIAGVINVQSVVRYVSALKGVAISKDYKYMCSDTGQEIIQKDIQEHKLNRIIVASCSPLLHEHTFRNATENAGLNPYYCQMVNIREHVSWVTEDKEEATNKAMDLIRAAVYRVRYHKALEKKEVPIDPNVLIVGGGIAGIHSALTMANAGKHVYLVEREPTIGGHMAKFDKTFPTLDCAACILTPKMSSVGMNKNITLLSYSDVSEVSGHVGNFNVKIKHKARYIDESKCTSCTQCIERCPVQNHAYPYPDFGRIDGRAHGLEDYVELEAEIKEHVDEILALHQYERAPLISVLQDINKDYGYLPAEILRYVSRKTEIQFARVYHVATFYKAFSLKPRGKYTVKVCMGTACHVRGAPKLLESFENRLEIKSGETTPDMKFTLETVNCLGACALAPVVTIGTEYHRDLSPVKIGKLIKSCE